MVEGNWKEMRFKSGGIAALFAALAFLAVAGGISPAATAPAADKSGEKEAREKIQHRVERRLDEVRHRRVFLRKEAKRLEKARPRARSDAERLDIGRHLEAARRELRMLDRIERRLLDQLHSALSEK